MRRVGQLSLDAVLLAERIITQAIRLGVYLMACCSSGPPRVPSMNLRCNVWFSYVGFLPPIAVPNLANVPCNLVYGGHDTSAGGVFPMFIGVPKLTDVAAGRGMLITPDVVECPAGSGRFYQVRFVDDVGKGWTNEYRQMLVTQLAPWPTPTP